MSTRDIARTIRRLAGTTIFSCRFIKRTTGEERLMVCRLGVTRHLTGGDVTYKAADKGLLPVWDTQKGAYRSIPLDGIISIRIAGIEYQIEDEIHKRRCDCCNEPLPLGNETDLCDTCLGLAVHSGSCTCGGPQCGYRSTIAN